MRNGSNGKECANILFSTHTSRDNLETPNSMTPAQKIFKVMSCIKHKSELSPEGAVIEYRAGYEDHELFAGDEIMILNKLSEEGVIEVTNNYSSEYE